MSIVFPVMRSEVRLCSSLRLRRRFFLHTMKPKTQETRISRNAPEIRVTGSQWFIEVVPALESRVRKTLWFPGGGEKKTGWMLLLAPTASSPPLHAGLVVTSEAEEDDVLQEAIIGPVVLFTGFETIVSPPAGFPVLAFAVNLVVVSRAGVPA